MFLELPLDVIVRILLELSPQDLLECRLTTKYLDKIVRESVMLQYAAALVSAKAENNVGSDLPVRHKLRALQAAEKSWAFVRPRFSKSITVSIENLGANCLMGGVFFVVASTRKAVHYFRLPSKEGDEISWKKIKSAKTIIAIGPCVYEHDLLVLLTKKHNSKNNRDSERFGIELDLLELSTGNPHPHAQESCIHIMTSKWDEPLVGIEIIGDNLVFVFSFLHERRPEDRIFIYDWKTGNLKTSFLAPFESYLDVLFLTEHLILLPNKHLRTLDIFRIPSAPSLIPPTPIVRLGLPALAKDDALAEISCRAEPNPIGAASHLRKFREAKDHANLNAGVGSRGSRAFRASAEDAICAFNLCIAVPEIFFHSMDEVVTEHVPTHRFTFLVHRNALCALANKYDKSEAKDDSNGNEKETETVPWADWGPPITRWFNSYGEWINSTAGQRYVRMEEGPSPSGGVLIYVMDFNEANVKKMKGFYVEEEDETTMAMVVDKGDDAQAPSPALQPGATPHQFEIEEVGEDDDGSEWETESESHSELSVDAPSPVQWKPPTNKRGIWASSAMEEVIPSSIFAERVQGALPYVGCTSEARYAFDGVVLDEERVIGLKINPSGNIDGIEVLHFG